MDPATCGTHQLLFASSTICGTAVTQNLMAGQHHLAGTVMIANDATNLYVTYQTVGDWKIISTELYVGDCAAIPVNKSGNPQIGHFPFKVTHDGMVTSYTYVLPLADFPADMCVAAHANVAKVDASGAIVQEETAWGEGPRFVTKGNWAMYFNYTKQVCESTPEVPSCYEEETACTAGDRFTDKGNWATYTSYTGGVQTVNIYAGQHHLAGTATFTPTGTGDIELEIVFAAGWGLQDDEESVKIQGFATDPKGLSPVAPGTFTTYKGTVTKLTLPMYAFYGIHLDVRKAVACE